MSNAHDTGIAGWRDDAGRHGIALALRGRKWRLRIASAPSAYPVHPSATSLVVESTASAPSAHSFRPNSGPTCQEYRQCIACASEWAGCCRSELASTGLVCTSDRNLGAAQDPLNALICGAFRHGEFPSPTLSAKNDVLDNGSYHELPMAGKAETPEWRRSLTITQGLLLKKSMSDADMLDDLRMSAMARKIAST